MFFKKSVQTYIKNFDCRQYPPTFLMFPLYLPTFLPIRAVARTSHRKHKFAVALARLYLSTF